jgi:hypothetical protein
MLSTFQSANALKSKHFKIFQKLTLLKVNTFRLKLTFNDKLVKF